MAKNLARIRILGGCRIMVIMIPSQGIDGGSIPLTCSSFSERKAQSKDEIYFIACFEDAALAQWQSNCFVNSRSSVQSREAAYMNNNLSEKIQELENKLLYLEDCL